jgi:hypothetical protein
MSLQQGDLKHMVYDIFEVDSFKSKMGEDRNIVTISFSVKENQVGKDLMTFIEKGYPFVLDADVTAGEQSDGTYKVFVELERSKDNPSQILEIVDGVQKLAELDRMKFRYYKNFRSKDVNQQSLEETLPLDGDDYDSRISGMQMENYQNFFNKSYIESVDMLDDVITLKKKYAEPINLQFEDIGGINKYDEIKESYNFDDFAEVIFLSKYIGDYNISKYGDKFTLENDGKVLIVNRK